MTIHEVLTSLFWLVAIAYATYLAWFLADMVRTTVARRARSTDQPHRSVAITNQPPEPGRETTTLPRR